MSLCCSIGKPKLAAASCFVEGVISYFQRLRTFVGYSLCARNLAVGGVLNFVLSFISLAGVWITISFASLNLMNSKTPASYFKQLHFDCYCACLYWHDYSYLGLQCSNH